MGKTPARQKGDRNMAENAVWSVLARVISGLGVLTGVVALAVIGWYLSMATHLLPRLPSGFFAA